MTGYNGRLSLYVNSCLDFVQIQINIVSSHLSMDSLLLTRLTTKKQNNKKTTVATSRYSISAVEAFSFTYVCNLHCD